MYVRVRANGVRDRTNRPYVQPEEYRYNVQLYYPNGTPRDIINRESLYAPTHQRVCQDWVSHVREYSRRIGYIPDNANSFK